MAKAIPTIENNKFASQGGFSLIELMMSTVIALVILAAGVAVFSGALSTRTRESSKTDAITSAQAALNIMSREIGNAGYGLSYNGIVTDSTASKLHFRANTVNNNTTTSDAGEDVVFYLDGSGANQSVVRLDKNNYDNYGELPSGIINRVSSVNFVYHVTQGDAGIAAGPTVNIVTITLTVNLENVQGQPTGQTVTVTSNVTLRNSPTMRGQY